MTTAVTGSAASAQVLCAAYEDLRRVALAGEVRGGGAPGLALLLRGGIVAWMGAWSNWVPASVAPSSASSSAASSSSRVPGEVRAEVAAVLAAMALAREEAA